MKKANSFIILSCFLFISCSSVQKIVPNPSLIEIDTVKISEKNESIIEDLIQLKEEVPSENKQSVEKITSKAKSNQENIIKLQEDVSTLKEDVKVAEEYTTSLETKLQSEVTKILILSFILIIVILLIIIFFYIKYYRK
jgi:ABC-type Na+ efflux pump permease subunit